MKPPNLSLLDGGGGSEAEAELELGLGLSLGTRPKPMKSSPSLSPSDQCCSSSSRGEYGRRILTAKDFPNGFPTSIGPHVSGNKRAAADSDVASPPSPPTISHQVVGWPPIRAYRMNNLVNQVKTPNAKDDNNKLVKGDEHEENTKKKMNHGTNKDDNECCNVKEKANLGFVKVNMDGLTIGRKVDLNAHASYETLARALEEMFFKHTTTISMNSATGGEKAKIGTSSKLLDGTFEFVLTYEDKEGDWMLVGDVPWGMFLDTVRRLRIMKTSEANGLAPKVQERRDRHIGKPV